MLHRGPFALALALLTATGCGSSAVAQCRLDAVSRLPLEDPDALSVGDVRQLATALKACTPVPDGGP